VTGITVVCPIPHQSKRSVQAMLDQKELSHYPVAFASPPLQLWPVKNADPTMSSANYASLLQAVYCRGDG